MLILRSLLSGFGVVTRGRAWFPASTNIFPYKSWCWSNAIDRYHRSGGERSATTPKPNKSVK
jgi:hypothetical protein